jgi:predicted HTH domain antitoxin
VTDSAPKTVSVQVELPADAIPEAEIERAELAGELRRLWILEQVRHHRISVGRGAELASVPLRDFMSWMGEHGIPVFDEDPAALDADLRRLRGPHESAP